MYSAEKLSSRYEWLCEQFYKSDDIVYHQFTLAELGECMVTYICGMVNQELLQEQLLEPLLQENPKAKSLKEVIALQVGISDYSYTTNLDHAMAQVLNGNVLLIVDGESEMALFPLIEYQMRSIGEANNETVIRGPKEAFVEDLQVNLTMIRRKIKSEKLTIEKMNFGTITHTQTGLLYVRGICTEMLVDEVKERLARVEIDGILGSNYLEAYLEDNPYSPFPQVDSTERPDIVAAALLDGRVAIMVDGSPIVIIAPVTFFMMLQSAEDYYQRHYAATWTRLLRFFFMIVSLLLPSFYIAATSFHPEMLPDKLIISIAAAREIVPFPVIVEAFMMEIVFEALREAGVRIPKPMGQAISILGALVIGTAAVQAGLVSAPMVIIVSLTGISSFIVPHLELGLSLRLLRFPLLIMSATLGMYGLVLGVIMITFHLCTLRSFGTPYLSPVAPLHTAGLKDVFIRVPWWLMNTRPTLYGTQNRVRQAKIIRPKIPKDDDGD